MKLIKAELIDLGPHDGMGEPDPRGAYRAFTLYDHNPNDPTEPLQSMTFMVPKHQLPKGDD